MEHGRGTEAIRVSVRTRGRVLAALMVVVTLVTSVGIAAGGIAVHLFRDDSRQNAGFLMGRVQGLATSTYAITSDDPQLHGDAPTVSFPRALLGDVEVDVTAAGGTAVFVGVAPTRLVRAYLMGVAHTHVVDGPASDSSAGVPVYVDTPGGAPLLPPGSSGIWSAQTSGTGTQTVVWSPEPGDWTVVMMNADGSRTVSVAVAAGATVPALWPGSLLLLCLAGVGLLVGVLPPVVRLWRSGGEPHSRR